ncbi:MAG TPA: 2-oxoglutarate dehydrogenase complex dihydrolipoyllysine-residue succinyltransferase [Gemmatimonadota bacterium]|nr:2-oxoglutarate dehydrogenase complex dihydrolipoyllysine-residue succinyltransferase [Gemmatimonadota bacterium]
MPMEVKVPSLGQSVPEATVGKWLKKVGDPVATDEALVELETDKINMEVTAFRGGTLAEIRAEEGATVAVGDVLAVIAEEGEQVGEAEAPEDSEVEAAEAPAEEEPGDAEDEEAEGEEPAEEEPAGEKPAAKAAPAKAAGKAKPAGKAAPEEKAAPRPKPAAERREAVIPDDMKTSPAVRRLAREHRLDLTEIEGSGKDGRVTKEDVLAWLEREPETAAPAAAPDREYGPDEPVERVPMTPIRKTIARRMSESKRTAAHVTNIDEADLGALVELRDRMKGPFQERHGVKLTYMPFFAKAAIAALKEFPQVNATIDGDEIVYHRFWHLGIAVHTEAGLVVPVVKHADRKSMVEIAREIEDLAARARERKLELHEIQGGTFTLTNAGGFGALITTPIISYPEVAVLGIHKIQERPVAKDGQVLIRQMMWLSLSYDHRLVDGTPAVLFLRRVCELLEDPERLLLEG